ncbi:MAG: hypothetical protein ABL996_06230 [Micropepsaceae bacterium]
MRLPILSSIALATAAAGAMIFTFDSPAAQASGGKCLRFRDMTNLSKIDDRTLLAHTRSSQKYIVTLRHACRDFGRPNNFYTFRLHSDTECFDRDDVLVFREGGACFVESVKPKPVSG